MEVLKDKLTLCKASAPICDLNLRNSVTSASNPSYWSTVHSRTVPCDSLLHLTMQTVMPQTSFRFGTGEKPFDQSPHVFSDGPAIQYKQMGNFYLLSKEPFNKGFKDISWNFFQASQGKGAPDGVGGTLKRSADKIDHHGGDIPNAEAVFHQLKNPNFSL